MGKLRPSGGYRTLASFQTSTIIYDTTVWFCEKFVSSRSRTVDQMVQAARSGRQNIAEGSRAAATSSQAELRLVNVARASLEELLLDYEDFLRHRHLATARLTERSRQKAGGSAEQIPPCPACGKTMVLRTARNGDNAGRQFWGCSGYPERKGSVRI